MSTQSIVRPLAAAIVTFALLVASVPWFDLNPQPLPPGGEESLSIVIGL